MVVNGLINSEVMVACHPAMSTSTSGGIVGKKFSFGTGPKPVVDKINKYFNKSKSIRYLCNLFVLISKLKLKVAP